MTKLVAPILDSNTDTDPEVQDVPETTKEQQEAATTSSDTKKSKQSEGEEEKKIEDYIEKAALSQSPPKENPDTNHEDPALYVTRKKAKRAIPGAQPEKATEVVKRVGQENVAPKIGV